MDFYNLDDYGNQGFGYKIVGFFPGGEKQNGAEKDFDGNGEIKNLILNEESYSVGEYIIFKKSICVITDNSDDRYTIQKIVDIDISYYLNLFSSSLKGPNQFLRVNEDTRIVSESSTNFTNKLLEDNNNIVGRKTNAKGAEIFNVVYGQDGNINQARAPYSHAEGESTIANARGQHVEGQYNIIDGSNSYLHIIGNGSSNRRSNALTVDKQGNLWVAGNVTYGNNRKTLAALNDSDFKRRLLYVYDNGDVDTDQTNYNQKDEKISWNGTGADKYSFISINVQFEQDFISASLSKEDSEKIKEIFETSTGGIKENSEIEGSILFNLANGKDDVDNLSSYLGKSKLFSEKNKESIIRMCGLSVANVKDKFHGIVSSEKKGEYETEVSYRKSGFGCYIDPSKKLYCKKTNVNEDGNIFIANGIKPALASYLLGEGKNLNIKVYKDIDLKTVVESIQSGQEEYYIRCYANSTYKIINTFNFDKTKNNENYQQLDDKDYAAAMNAAFEESNGSKIYCYDSQIIPLSLISGITRPRYLTFQTKNISSFNTEDDDYAVVEIKKVEKSTSTGTEKGYDYQFRIIKSKSDNCFIKTIYLMN